MDSAGRAMLCGQWRITSAQRTPMGRGGDFFEVVADGGGWLSTLVGDVCGNGPAAAALVPSLRAVARRHLARGEAPAAVLAALNTWLSGLAGGQDRFVTALAVRVHVGTGASVESAGSRPIFLGTLGRAPNLPRRARLGQAQPPPTRMVAEIASAGHLGPFLKRANGTARVLPLAAGAALGMWPAQHYPQATFVLGRQDVVVLATDGVTDPLASAGDALGQLGVLRRLSGLPTADGNTICAALLRDVRDLVDASVIVLEPSARAIRSRPVRMPAMAARNDVEAAARVRRTAP